MSASCPFTSLLTALLSTAPPPSLVSRSQDLARLIPLRCGPPFSLHKTQDTPQSRMAAACYLAAEEDGRKVEVGLGGRQAGLKKGAFNELLMKFKVCAVNVTYVDGRACHRRRIRQGLRRWRAPDLGDRRVRRGRHACSSHEPAQLSQNAQLDRNHVEGAPLLSSFLTSILTNTTHKPQP